ncbi:MAG: hypothetical protein HKN16_11425, partial [Saprospiraceae bacterium]|nr:hypothetical protein [Saprospiraceae bacterium]
MKQDWERLIRDYKTRMKNFAVESKAMQKKAFRFSLVRLAHFVLGLGLTLFVFTLSTYGGIAVLFVSILVFAFMVRHSLRLQSKIEFLKAMSEINRKEANLIGHNFSNLRTGDQFLPKSHVYAADLDILGDHSLFQYVNRASTHLGDGTLANWLLIPAKPNILPPRRESIIELSDQLSWRQEFQASGFSIKDAKRDFDILLEWMKEKPVLLTKNWVRWAYWLAPIWFIVSTYLCFTVLNLYYLILAWGIPLWIHSRFMEVIDKA